MLQALVENAIKHGLEPRPEGGQLSVRSEIRDGKLLVSVSDTGVGLHSLSSAGVGLSNIRERLQLIYGPDAVLNLTPLAPHGTLATLSLPYRHRNEAHRADAMGANRPPGNG
jgi:LytS/YehU family sensor histidine kinase